MSKRPPPEERARRPGRPPAVRKQFQEEENTVSQKDACLYDLVRNGKSSLTVSENISSEIVFYA